MLQVHQRRAASLTAALLAGMVLAGGCTTQGLVFRRDSRVEITAPRDRASVSLPFEVRWTFRDLDIGPGAGSFGVLVDRAPPGPGKTLESLVDEPGCRREDGCPDNAFLAQRNIYRTTATTHRIEQIANFGAEGRRERHEVTIVVLDRSGRRAGEAAYSVEFEIARQAR